MQLGITYTPSRFPQRSASGGKKPGGTHPRARTGASVAEVDGQETWQRTTLGVAMVSGEKAFLDKQVQLVRRLAEDQTEAELTWFTVEYY